MITGAFPGPLRHFLAQLDELPSGESHDMDMVGRALLELAADEEFFAPLIAQIPSDSPGVHWLVRPERGPRLVLVHRPEGVMAYTHSHRCWVALAPVRGVETHQHWDVVRQAGGRAELTLAGGRLHRSVLPALLQPAHGDLAVERAYLAARAQPGGRDGRRAQRGSRKLRPQRVGGRLRRPLFRSHGRD